MTVQASTPQPITIVVASDNFYAVLIAPLLKSIEMHHTGGEALEFVIIDDGISAANRARLQRTINPATSTLQWVKSADAFAHNIKIPVDKTAFPAAAYLRLYAPYIIAPEREKVLYLDCDMIVQTDIAKLWHTDLGGRLFGAVQDLQGTVSCSWGGIPNHRELGIPADSKYFNSGLLLINARKWREENTTTKVIQCLIDNRKYVNWPDQYGLNAALANQWLELDPRWNWYASLPDTTPAGDAPFILHFLDVKPVFTSYASNPSFQEEFYRYMRLTPWKNHRPVSDYRRIIRKTYNKIKKMFIR